ncbi:hypothetical protein F3I62_19140 [Pseudomonas sp. R-28-1W-6]|uniref:hypothetical protein n=1 Tax=Pseudomonas sp. R-28-1W-6 TaxID=2650101 RepID=UPI001365AECC|nr:hypothetical protein [Pseudomonas sp. R-28-1W-6]MWV14222.1 hypothetical protein [Pseudomonas sp. R-28-1W-6]
MTRKIRINEGVHITKHCPPRVVVTTDHEPIESEIRYTVKGGSAFTSGYTSGASIEFVMPIEALFLLSAGSPLWIGNLGGSEDAFEAREIRFRHVLTGLLKGALSKVGRFLAISR